MIDTAKLTRPIVLVGLMGAGKTSVGKLVAKRLGLAFEDSDSEIVKAAGCSVVDIFNIFGETEFRRVEDRVVHRLLAKGDVKVLSTGEGAFIIDSVRRVLKENAITVWLKADLNLLVKRTSFKDTRPLLLDHSPREILDKLIADRYPIYSLADITVETRNESTYLTCDKVLAAIEKYLEEK
ncbi:MAG: shikimate kinase [Rickettsiales bacterium]|jgi:shikimate kinase|nr:shikimate kinase [Rickettsiales bacterium]